MNLKSAIEHAEREFILLGWKIDKKGNVRDTDGNIQFYASFALKLFKQAYKAKIDRSELDLVIDWLQGYNDFHLLSDITNDPNEWKFDEGEYRNLRNLACISKDLITYKDTKTGNMGKSWDYKIMQILGNRPVNTYKIFKDKKDPYKLASEVLK